MVTRYNFFVVLMNNNMIFTTLNYIVSDLFKNKTQT